jgi:exodeoxyribonuclease VII small subunit
MATPVGDRISEAPQDQLAEAPSFEQTLGRLEEIVHLLEEGKIGLDEALGRYEEGVALLRKANELLERAQRRISLLSGLDSEGNPILRPMEDTASFSPERDVAGPAAAPGTRERAKSRQVRRQADPDTP